MIYYVTLPSQTVATPLLTYQTADAGARVTVTQPLSPNGVGIVMVISADTSIFKVYQVYFSVAVSTDATLASLSYQGNPIQNFDAAVSIIILNCLTIKIFRIPFQPLPNQRQQWFIFAKPNPTTIRPLSEW